MLIEEVKKKLRERVNLNRPIHPVEIIGEDWKYIPDFYVRETKSKLEIIREESNNAVVLSILLSMDNYIIGYVSAIQWKRPPLVVSSHFWFMESISIKKEFRNRGYGMLLMQTLMDLLKDSFILTLCRKEMIKWYTEKIGGWHLMLRAEENVIIKKPLNKKET